MNTLMSQVGDEEQIVRILHQEWLVDGELQLTAFALCRGETYLSVNRPAVDTFDSDISDFVNKHPNYIVSEDTNICQFAELPVTGVRNISVSFNEQVASLSVEVEPRSSHYQSHAGIFTRIGGKNLKGGQQGEVSTDDGQVISYEAIYQKVQLNLLQLANLRSFEITSSSE